ncbi:MAG: type II toxin-antitoxin system death-on-curing family toxin [Patescibacteria group bacterium]|nr:type II toxin-antitoxin system death-on-curing family toxin [Patescibacteria group bacterium]
MKTLTLAEVEYLAYRLAKENLEFDEPIPEFGSRFPHILETCLVTPFQKWQKADVYHGLIAKAAILFYLMIKNHPFQNGNKRIAITALFVFLHKNNKWLKVNSQELYNFAIWVAQSPAKLNKEVLTGIEKFLKAYLVNLF